MSDALRVVRAATYLSRDVDKASADQPQALHVHHDKARRAAYKKKFQSEFADWIAAQNAYVAEHGVPGADMRPW